MAYFSIIISVLKALFYKGKSNANNEANNKERIAVSQDEFIVPADVVSMLGDGSSNAGSQELYDMMDRVRQERTGTTQQAPQLANAGGLMPA